MPCSGTTLMVAHTPDGIVMAVDDLGYSKVDGVITPRETGIEKLFVLDENIIGSEGLMRHSGIKYKFEDWISTFIQKHYRTLPNKHPGNVAAALEDQMKETFHAIEAIPDDDVWKLNPPIKRLVTYVVAGYAEDRCVPHIFEFGVNLNIKERRVVYQSAQRYRFQNPIVFGEENFLRRAKEGLEPEKAYWESSIPGLYTSAAIADIPRSLQELVAASVGLIQVEAKFNENKVGKRVRVGVLDCAARTSFLATF